MIDIKIKFADIADVPVILSFIKELAAYEKLSHEVLATEDLLRENLFGERRYAEVIFAFVDNKPVGMALFFNNFSTFLAKPGIYLEDLYVLPEMRGLGVARNILSFLARLALERDYGRLEWSVLDWNAPAIRFYKSIGAKSMDGWSVNRLNGAGLDSLANNPRIG